MKIILVHNSYQRPGGEDVIFEQECKLLQDRGHQVVTYTRTNFEVEQYKGVRRLLLAGKTIWSGESRNQFLELLHRERPDLVHVHNTFVMISPSIYSACRQSGVPVVQTLHNFRLLCPGSTFFRDGGICEECADHGLWKSVQHACYRNSRPATAAVALMLQMHRMFHTWERDITSFIALTEFTRKKFVDNGIPGEKVFVKPNFVDPDPGTGDGKREYALFAGRLSPEKRVTTVLAAWRLLPRHIPLMVIGGGPERDALQKAAAAAGLSHVQFRGQLSRDETLAAMRQARFLVFSSEWYENFPVTIAESFASGLPVLCSKLGAMEEIVTHGHTGLHFEPGSPHDLADKVAWAWDHPEFMAAIAKTVRREYEEKYTAEKNYHLLMEIYERTIAAKTSRDLAPAPATSEPCLRPQTGD